MMVAKCGFHHPKGGFDRVRGLFRTNIGSLSLKLVNLKISSWTHFETHMFYSYDITPPPSASRLWASPKSQDRDFVVRAVKQNMRVLSPSFRL